ncbi:MAG: hydrolase [Gammaproteobacteria bacterium]|nr:hydrolase [Gammaproteobacteria bacterium]
MIRTSCFRPAWWLRGAHAQTIWPSFTRHLPALKLEWERLELPENDFLDLVWTAQKAGPIVIVLHGLEGSINSHYAKGILYSLHNNSWRAVFMHFRGCSGTHNRKARSYHSGETGDLRFLIRTLHARHPDSLLAAIGFSLGGNTLLKYLGEDQDNAILRAAVAISVPFELSAGADRLNQGFSKLYQWHLLKRLQKKIIDKFRVRNDAPFSIKDVPNWNTFHLFDNFVTAPLHGFKSSEHYYSTCSSRQYLPLIKVPTLILHAEDDPFLTPDAIPRDVELPDNVILELSKGGGHVGFISGHLPWQSCYWLEERVPEFLRGYIN